MGARTGALPGVGMEIRHSPDAGGPTLRRTSMVYGYDVWPAPRRISCIR
jgi:hypothetical protein